jgi:hypothetical protein
MTEIACSGTPAAWGPSPDARHLIGRALAQLSSRRQM